MTKRWLKGWTAGGLAAAAVSLGAGCGAARLPTKAVGETVLTVRGQVKSGPYYLQASDLAALPKAGFMARPPGAEADVRYDGADLKRMVEYHLQPTEGADTLVFVTKDGLALPVTVGLIRQYGPILAYQVDGKTVTPRLAWPNLDQRGLDADPRAALWWTGPVETLEVVSWDRTWGRALRPPPGSSDGARLGAGQYALRCAACHKHHGVGGQRGPSLDGTVARLGAAPFVAAVQRHEGWPARLGTELAAGEDVAGQVAAFLAASDVTGVPPPEEVKPQAARPAPRPGGY